MRVASIFCVGVLTMLFAAPAEALTITNSDAEFTQDHREGRRRR